MRPLTIVVMCIALLFAVNVTYAQEISPSLRTAKEREMAIELIRVFAQDPSLEITFKSSLPGSYSPTQLVEVYEAEGYLYEIDVASSQVVQVVLHGLNEDLSNSEEITYTSEQLENLAQEFIRARIPQSRLQELVPRHSDKIGQYFFFRWEIGRVSEEKLTPFIQVGLSRSGTLLSYANTLDLPLSSSPSGVVPDDHYYASNGKYWSTVAWWGTVTGFGYCGNIGGGGWCSPFSMRYTHPACGYVESIARWDNIDYHDSAAVRAFIPSNHAWSTRAPYTIRANHQDQTGFMVNQAIYSDQWATLNYEPLTLVQSVSLQDNTCESSTVRIGADEIKLDYTWWNP